MSLYVLWHVKSLIREGHHGIKLGSNGYDLTATSVEITQLSSCEITTSIKIQLGDFVFFISMELCKLRSTMVNCKCKSLLPGMVAHTCNTIICKAEAGGSL